MRTALIVHGSATSVAALQAWCPTASRRAIATWLHADRRRRRDQLQIVRWHRMAESGPWISVTRRT